MADLRNTRTSDYWRDIAMDALMASLAGAKVKVYTGAQVATPATAATGTLLVTLVLGGAGTITSVNGLITATPIASVAAVAAGVAGWFRVMDSAEVNVLFDGNVGGNADGDTNNFELPSTTIAVGMLVGATQLTYTFPMQGL